MKTDEHFTIQELNAVFLSRQIRNGERALVGANVLVPRAGVPQACSWRISITGRT